MDYLKENNNLYRKAYNFSLRIIKAYKYLNKEKQEFILSKQMLRSGTSIGANIAEANGAISKAEFSMKLFIAYKEILEVQYWLNLLKDTDYIDEATFASIIKDASELGKILYSIIIKIRAKR